MKLEALIDVFARRFLLRGRNAMEAGDAAAAVAYLQKVPDLDSQPEVLKMLFQGYIASDRLTEAGVLATKLLNAHNDIESLSSFVAALMKNGLFQDALQIYHEYFERFMAADKGKAMEKSSPMGPWLVTKPVRRPTSVKLSNCWLMPA